MINTFYRSGVFENGDWSTDKNFETNLQTQAMVVTFVFKKIQFISMRYLQSRYFICRLSHSQER